MVARCRSSSAASGSRRSRPSDTSGQALPGAQHHHGRRRPPRPRLRGRCRRSASARVAAAAGDPRVLAERRRLRGRDPAALDATPSPSTALTLSVYRTNGSLVGSRSVPDPAAGAQTWDWNGTLGGRGRQERALRPAAGRARPAAGRSTRRQPADDARPGRRVRRHRRHGRPDGQRLGVDDPDLAQRRRHPRRVRLAMTSSGATRWAAPRRLARPAPSGPPTAPAVRSRSPGAATGDSGARVADGRYTAHAGRDGRAPATRPGARSRSSSTRRRPAIVDGRGSGPPSRPNGDGAQDATRLVVDRQRARQRHRADPAGHARSSARGPCIRRPRWAATWNGANRGRQARRRRPLRAARRRSSTPAATARAASRPGGRGPHGGLPRAGRASSTRRTATRSRRARPCPGSSPATRRPRSACTTRPARSSGPCGPGRCLARRRPPLGVERPARERRVRPAGPLRGAPDGHVVAGHGRPGARRLGERVRASTPSATAAGPARRCGDRFTTIEPLGRSPRSSRSSSRAGRRSSVTATRRTDGSYRRHVQGAAGRRRRGARSEISAPRRRRPHRTGRSGRRAGSGRTLTPR